MAGAGSWQSARGSNRVLAEPSVRSDVQTFVELMMRSLAHPVFRKAKSMIRKLIMATMLGGLLLGATACNTVKGAGDDLKSVSKTTEDAIN